MSRIVWVTHINNVVSVVSLGGNVGTQCWYSVLVVSVGTQCWYSVLVLSVNSQCWYSALVISVATQFWYSVSVPFIYRQQCVGKFAEATEIGANSSVEARLV